MFETNYSNVQSQEFPLESYQQSQRSDKTYNHLKNNVDIEAYNSENDIKGFAFKEENIRKAFIRKVYCILTNQLLITFGIVFLIYQHKPTQIWIYNNGYTIWIAFFVMFAIIISLSCFEHVRRSSPINILLLSIFTLAESFVIGVISSYYDKNTVIISIGMTIFVCLGLTLFSFQTKWDFTIYGGVLLTCLIIFIIFSLLATFLPGGKTLSLVYASIGAILISFYLIYDTQLMMGGDHKYAISPEEYIFAVLSLYLDVINIFIYILSIIGNARS